MDFSLRLWLETSPLVSVDNVWYCCFLYCYSLPRRLLNLPHCHWFCVNSPPISPSKWCYSCQYAICSHCRFLTICDVFFIKKTVSSKVFANLCIMMFVNSAWIDIAFEMNACDVVCFSCRIDQTLIYFWCYMMPSFNEQNVTSICRELLSKWTWYQLWDIYIEQRT